MAASGQRFYEDEEAEQILRMAASISSPVGQLSRERLLETAAELGISPEAVETAERQFHAEKSERDLEVQFQAHARSEFYAHLTTYLLVNAFLLFVNLRTSPGHPWVLWSLLGWGSGLAGHAVTVFFKGSRGYDDNFERWRLRHEGKAPLSSTKSPRGLYVGIHVGKRGDRRSLKR